MQWLSGNPDELWGALVGTAVLAGGIALLAVWLANRNSRRQLSMQLAADKEQRERDRSMSVRRDVYIPAAEAISRIQGVISELADLGADHSVLSRRITTDLSSLAKISVLGTDATVFAISRLTAATTLAHLQLIGMRQKLLQRHGKVKTALTARDAAVNQRQQMAELLRQAFASGNKDPTLLRRLQAQLECDTTAADARQREVEQLLEDQANEERELLLHALGANQEVLKYVPDAFIAVRQELELPINERELRRLLAEQQTAALDVARHLMKNTSTAAQPAQPSAGRDLAAKEPAKAPGAEENRSLILPEGVSVSLQEDLPDLH